MTVGGNTIKKSDSYNDGDTDMFNTISYSDSELPSSKTVGILVLKFVDYFTNHAYTVQYSVEFIDSTEWSSK